MNYLVSSNDKERTHTHQEYLLHAVLCLCNLSSLPLRKLQRKNLTISITFLQILAKGIGQQLKQGLYREYIEHDDIPVVRCKIDLGNTIRNQISQKRIVSCEYDELSENNLLNQILKTMAILLHP